MAARSWHRSAPHYAFWKKSSLSKLSVPNPTLRFQETIPTNTHSDFRTQYSLSSLETIQAPSQSYLTLDN
nr:hypothetical protein Q903MT_gene2307 [Picea sitchensis]